MKRSSARPTTSDLLKGFLTVAGKERSARLVGPPEFPRPIKARLDRDGYLSWLWYNAELGGRGLAPKLRKPRNNLCFEFARLAHGSDEDIRRFAEKWGPLGKSPREEEHLNEWRHYAALAHALLRFAVEKTEGRVSKEAWRTICAAIPAGNLDEFRLTAREQTVIAASALNAWFAAARGHRILDAADGQFQIRPGASNLFGVLAAQVAHAMARSDELARCAGCKAAFTPKRPISHGSRQYCSRCRRGKVPQRDASRDWRNRRRKPF